MSLDIQELLLYKCLNLNEKSHIISAGYINTLSNPLVIIINDRIMLSNLSKIQQTEN